MVSAIQIAGLCMVAVLFTTLLRRHAPEQAVLLSMLAVCGVTLWAGMALSPVLVQIDTMLQGCGLTGAEIGVIGKAAGICCITQLAGDICKDSGEAALATAVTLAGKTALLLLALPFAQILLSVMDEVLS
ncbi:MAG: stage III sporulation protein AD [Oscillospiraceae bacterium]|nr:stage III sporulation protein AD [Ruminococcus sp.]MBQ4346451.1 stage III sporulation protein AD [Oscillospiraceae bacterium]